MGQHRWFLLLLLALLGVCSQAAETIETDDPDAHHNPDHSDTADDDLKATSDADTIPHDDMAEEEEGDSQPPDDEEGDSGETDGGMDDEEDTEGGMEKSDPLSPEMMTALHKKIDSNGNGKVSLAEVVDFAHDMRRKMAKSEIKEIMTELDTDKDGKLTWLEFLGDEANPTNTEEDKKEKEIQFKEIDVNKDGHVDENELPLLYHHHTDEKAEDALTQLAMKDKDTDKNGMLSLREFYSHLQVEDEDPVEIAKEDEEIFKKLDTDGSNSLTLKELKAWESGSFQAEQAVQKLFTMADANKDNVLTEQELHDAREHIADHEQYEPQMYLSQWAEQHTAEHGEL